MVDGQEGAQPGAGNGGTPPAWTTGISGEQLGYITNRGLDKLSERDAFLKTIEAHRQAEQKLGVPADKLLRMPNDANDQDGWNRVYGTLGKPKDPNGYDFTGVKDVGEDFTNFVRDFAFKHNLTKTQGEALMKEFDGYANGLDQKDALDLQMKTELERNSLRKEFGLNYNAVMMTAQNTVKSLGIDPQAVATLEKQIGYAGVIKMFHQIGQRLGEDKFITSEVTGDTMTAQGAKERISQLFADPDWTKRYTEGGKTSKEFKQYQDLLKLSLGIGA